MSSIEGARRKDLNVFRLFLLMFAILAVDFISKGMINFYIQPIEVAPHFFPFGGISVFRDFFGIDFCIHHVTNRGAAWGIASGMQDLLLYIRLAVVLGLLVYLFSKAKESRYPLMLIIAGGIGNILDYFIYGHVIDMFHLFFWGYSYPVFNVADASICIGIAWLLLHSFLRKKNVVAPT